jgi:hypothetical protein
MVLGPQHRGSPFNRSTLAKNRDRLLKDDVSRLFFEAVVNQARQLHLLSNRHFTADLGPRSRA